MNRVDVGFFDTGQSYLITLSDRKRYLVGMSE